MRFARIVAGIVALGAICAISETAQATSYRAMAPKVLLHVRALTSKNPCVLPVGIADNCANLVTTGDLNTAYYTYLVSDQGDSLAATLVGVAGVQVGVNYQGDFNTVGGATPIDVFGWTLCASLEFKSDTWPAPGSGNLMTFDATNRCQTTRLAVCGYFYMEAYGAASMQLTPRPVDQKAKVATCGAFEINIGQGNLGIAQFSAAQSVPGCNPCVMSCEVVPVQTTTWSRVKTLSTTPH